MQQSDPFVLLTLLGGVVGPGKERRDKLFGLAVALTILSALLIP
jgi:hypothetical protein